MKLKWSIVLFVGFYLFSIFMLCVMVCSCGPTKNCYENNYFSNVSNYSVSPNSSTQSGIQVDVRDVDYSKVDLSVLDARIKAIEECLSSVAQENPTITSEQQKAWQCIRSNFSPEPFKRDCLVVKIVDPVYSKCSDQQFISAPAPKALCEAKGLTPTAECPCLWRSAIQNNNVLITPPALYLFDLGRIWSSCNNIWYSPFAKCLTM